MDGKLLIKNGGGGNSPEPRITAVKRQLCTTRRKLVGGLAAIIATQSCPAVLTRSLLAARQIFLGTSQSNAEEEMYKELFIGLTENTLPETLVLPAEITNIARPYWLCSSTCKEVTMLGSDIRSASNSLAYGSANLTKINLPNITEYSDWGFVSNQYALHIDLYIPKCRRFRASTYMFDPPSGKTIGIHIDELTCAEIMNIPNFPGLHSSAYERATFYGSDGSVSYDGSAWVITPNA